jgi:hypothetical protein
MPRLAAVGVAGSNIVYFDRTEFDRVTIPTGPLDGEYESAETMEGEVLSLSYTFDNPDISTLQIKRNYTQALEERGFEILYAASNEDLSGGTGRLFFTNADIFSRGARDCCRFASGNREIRYLAARSADGSVLAGIAAFNAQRVDGPAVSMTVVTSEVMDTAMDHRPLTAGEMETGLIEDGRVAVQDILFEFDSAAILPDSAGDGGPMRIDRSASRTCRASSSASEWTAIGEMPSSRHAQMIRSAISPRLAIRIFLNMPQLVRIANNRSPYWTGFPFST